MIALGGADGQISVHYSDGRLERHWEGHCEGICLQMTDRYSGYNIRHKNIGFVYSKGESISTIVSTVWLTQQFVNINRNRCLMYMVE